MPHVRIVFFYIFNSNIINFGVVSRPMLSNVHICSVLSNVNKMLLLLAWYTIQATTRPHFFVFFCARDRLSKIEPMKAKRGGTKLIKEDPFRLRNSNV